LKAGVHRVVRLAAQHLLSHPCGLGHPKMETDLAARGRVSGRKKDLAGGEECGFSRAMSGLEFVASPFELSTGHRALE